MENKVLISVVTVSYNAVSTIEQTILSVINQTYPHIEYIIIDGGSTDGTVDVIKKYADRIAYWVSEPDKGIYDAMNKGIKKATGEWINFMNSGDYFWNLTVISKLFTCQRYNDKLVLYGNVIFDTDFGTFHAHPYPLNCMTKQSVIYHQASFINLEYHKSHLFDLKYKIAGDYNFFFQLYKERPELYQYIDNDIAYYEAISGISTKNQVLSYIERRHVQGSPPSYMRILFFRLKFSISSQNILNN